MKTMSQQKKRKESTNGWVDKWWKKWELKPVLLGHCTTSQSLNWRKFKNLTILSVGKDMGWQSMVVGK